MAARVTDLSGKNILIVGATTGIGAAITRLSAQAGASVIAVGRDQDRGLALASECGATFIAADIARSEQVESLFTQIAARGMSLEGAVNNAATTQEAIPIDQTSVDEFDRVMAINLRGTWQCLSHEVRAMRGRGGSIVNVASIAGKRGFAGLSIYCASKHAVIGMTKAAALDGASDNIRVNALLPGTTRTAMMEQQMRTRPGGLEGTIARIPLGRVATPDDQAKAAIWLLSDESGFVTGDCLTVDGGTTARS